MVKHLSHLRLWINWEKSKLSPVQIISFFSMELESVIAELPEFQKLLWHMAPTAVMMPLDWMQMRLPQDWLHSQVPKWVWHHSTNPVTITMICRCSFTLSLSLFFSTIVHEQQSHIGVHIFQVGESSVQGEGNSIVCGTVAAICKL